MRAACRLGDDLSPFRVAKFRVVLVMASQVIAVAAVAHRTNLNHA